MAAPTRTHLDGRWLLGLLALLLPAVALAQTAFVGGNRVQVGWTNFCDATGSATNTYVCDFTTGQDITEYNSGVDYAFLANAANTGAATINFSGVGAKTIKVVRGGVTTDLAANQIRAGHVVVVRYDGTNMQCLNCGGVLPTTSTLYLGAASCQGTSAALAWDVLASGAPTAACYGTTRPKGVADFGDAADMAMHVYLPLPTDWVPPLDARVVWFAAATTNTVRMGVRVDCYGANENHDGTVTNSTTFAATPSGTANGQVFTTVTNITTTGCAAGELARVEFFRDGDGTSGTDSMTGDARVEGIELLLRRLQ